MRTLAAQLGSRRLLVMGGVALALMLVLGWVAMRSPSEQMGFLYSDLDPQAAQSITEKLKAENVPFQLSPDGTAVMAPSSKLAELRMSMASEQLGGKIGYDVLDQEEPFGVSASRAKMNETRAIEGELAKSIESIQNIAKARVHIVMPERAMFAAEGRKATAAVTVKTRGALSGQSVQAIRYLISSSVPELAPESVSIVDHKGALLARAGEGGGTGSTDVEELQTSVEARLRSQIEAMVEPIVGAGKVRAEVAAVIERASVREEANVFDPDKQVIGRQITVESADQDQENTAGAEPTTVAAQLPENQNQPGGGEGDTKRSSKNENSEDTTYENSKTHSVTVRSPGKINRLTVAVLVDGGAKGIPAPQLQRLTRLVENAVGFDAERGDSVVVESLAFAQVADPGAEEGMLANFDSGPIFEMMKILAIGAVGLVALWMLRRQRGETELPGGSTALLGTGESPSLSGPAQDELSMRQLEAVRAAENDVALLDQEIALAQVDGRVKLSAVKRIGDAISASPAESASVIRQWMNG